MKFRVWDKKDKRYIPYPIFVSSDGMIIRLDAVEKSQILNKDQFKIEKFTGLKDKNGINIYENDILEIYRLKNYSNPTLGGENGGFNWYDSIEKATVRWFQTGCKFILEYSGYDDCEDLLSCVHRYEVISQNHE